MNKVSVVFCTYNRADYLPDLIRALRSQICRLPFEIVIVNNNSTDQTVEVVEALAREEGVPVRLIHEPRQGIVHARNRAIEETFDSEYMVVMDDDELPRPGFIETAVDALDVEGADCVGGRVRVDFKHLGRPSWLGDELLGFLAEVDYGDEPFWINDKSTPVWTANVAYRTVLFRDGLRYDLRYNRAGKAVGGGSDLVMFETLVERRARIRYRPDMVVDHYVEKWRLRRGYFLKLHYVAGRKKGLWRDEDYRRTIYGVPPFMISQAARHFGKTLAMGLTGKPGLLRQTMNFTYAMGMIRGRFERWRQAHD